MVLESFVGWVMPTNVHRTPSVTLDANRSDLLGELPRPTIEA